MLIENEYIKLNKIDKISARVIFLLFILAICIILNHLISYIFAFIYFIVSSYNIKKILNEKPKKFYNHTEHIKSINIDKNYIEIIKIDNQSKLYNKEDLKKIIIDINLGNATFGQWYSDTLIYKLIIKFEIDNEQQYRLETYKYKNINPNLKFLYKLIDNKPLNTKLLFSFSGKTNKKLENNISEKINYYLKNHKALFFTNDEKNEIIKIAIFILISFFIFVGVLALSFN